MNVRAIFSTIVSFYPSKNQYKYKKTRRQSVVAYLALNPKVEILLTVWLRIRWLLECKTYQNRISSVLNWTATDNGVAFPKIWKLMGYPYFTITAKSIMS